MPLTGKSTPLTGLFWDHRIFFISFEGIYKTNKYFAKGVYI